MRPEKILHTCCMNIMTYSQITFFEIKGIVGGLGEMQIPLKLSANIVHQRPYRLNPKYKEKVKVKIDRMLATRIIEPVE
jgi:hypothetical protein